MATEKRFPANARKRRKQRRQGDVAKTEKLSAAFQIALFICYYRLIVEPYQILTLLFHKMLGGGTDFHSNHVLVSVTSALTAVGILVIVPLIAAGLLGIFVEVCQVGLYFLFGQLFRFSRLNIVHGLRRIIGMREAADGSSTPIGIPAEILKLVAYLLAVVIAVASVLRGSLSELLSVEIDTVEHLRVILLGISGQLLTGVCAAWLGIAVIELLFARRQRENRLRMTREEFQRETRESEGDPQMVGMRKQMHQELALHQTIEGVRRASAVVVN